MRATPYIFQGEDYTGFGGWYGSPSSKAEMLIVKAEVVQLVEQRSCKPSVVGSTPTFGSKHDAPSGPYTRVHGCTSHPITRVCESVVLQSAACATE